MEFVIRFNERICEGEVGSFGAGLAKREGRIKKALRIEWVGIRQ